MIASIGKASPHADAALGSLCRMQQEESTMTTDDLVLWTMGVVLIGTGLPVVYLARYFLAPEEQKRRKARHLMGIGLVWLVAGAGIYLRVLIG
jgi:hypothetical protein